MGWRLQKEGRKETKRGMEKAKEFQKNIYFCFISYAKAFVWITVNCGKF